jgi:PleD family two-component response regulator
MLAVVPVPGSVAPLSVTVSAGVAAFAAVDDLERALETADERMYRRKLTRRATVGSTPS